MLFVLTTCPCNISVIHILPKNIIYHTGHISRQKMTSIQAITASGGLRERHKQKNKKEANAKKDVVKTGPTFGLPFDQLWYECFIRSYVFINPVSKRLTFNAFRLIYLYGLFDFIVL